MRFFRICVSVSIGVLISSASAFAQLPTFSGFWLTPQLTAPTAMAGNDAYQVTAHYGRQGFEESTGYRTFLLSGQIPIYDKANTQFGTLGVNIIRDESGASYLFTTSGAMLSYLYDAEIAQRQHLVGGVQAGYYGRRIDRSKISTNNQFANGNFDPALSSGEQFPDDPSQAFIANVGLGYYLTDSEGAQLFHLGVALGNANRGSYNYLLDYESQSAASPLKAYAHVRLTSNPFFDVVSDLYWRHESKVHDITGGFRVRKGTSTGLSIADHHLGLGLYYSQDHTGVLALQLIQPDWLIGISYDVVFGNKPLQNMQNGVEVTLGWRAIRVKEKRKYNPRKHKRKLPWED